MPQHEHDDGKDKAGASDPFSQLGEDVGRALRREVDELRAELGERAATAARGAALLAGAGASASVACAALLTLPLMALRRVLPAPAIAVLVAAGAGSLSAYLARRGLRDVEVAAPVDTEPIKRAARRTLRSVS